MVTKKEKVRRQYKGMSKPKTEMIMNNRVIMVTKKEDVRR